MSSRKMFWCIIFKVFTNFSHQAVTLQQPLNLYCLLEKRNSLATIPAIIFWKLYNNLMQVHFVTSKRELEI